MDSMYKALLTAFIVGLFVFIADKSESNVILNIVILFIVLTMVSFVFRKFEEKRKKEE